MRKSLTFKIKSSFLCTSLDLIAPLATIRIELASELVLLRQALIDCQVAAAEEGPELDDMEIGKTLKVEYFFSPKTSYEPCSFVATITSYNCKIFIESLLTLERAIVAIDQCLLRKATR